MLALCLTLYAAGIGLHVEEAEGLSASEAAQLTRDLATAIETRTGTAPVSSSSSAACVDADRCVARLGAELGTGDVVLLRYFGGPRAVRVIAERFAPGYEPRVAERDVLRSAISPPALAPIAEALFAARAAPPPITRDLAPAPEPGPRWAPWVLVAAAAAGAGVATGFALSARDAAGDLEAALAAGPVSDSVYAPLEDRRASHGQLSAIVFGASAAVLTAGIVWLLLE